MSLEGSDDRRGKNAQRAFQGSGNAMGKFSAGKTSASPSGNEEEVWHGCICGLSSKSRLEKKDVLSASVLAMVKMNA